MNGQQIRSQKANLIQVGNHILAMTFLAEGVVHLIFVNVHDNGNAGPARKCSGLNQSPVGHRPGCADGQPDSQAVRGRILFKQLAVLSQKLLDGFNEFRQDAILLTKI